MLFILEIILTVLAWRKGWKAKALIPGAIGIGLGIFIGLMCAAASAPIPAGLFVFDIGVILGLIVMMCNPPTKSAQTVAVNKPNEEQK